MSFQPTIRLVITEQGQKELEEQGLTAQGAMDIIVDFYENQSIRESVSFNASAVEDIASGQQVEDYESVVVGTFKSRGVLHLRLATGDIIALEA